MRKRHYGDTQDPVATRTSGVGASARSLIFVDGILVSSPIGNNNTRRQPAFRHRRAAGRRAHRRALWPLLGALCRQFHRRGASTSPPACPIISSFMPTHWARCRTFSQYATDRHFGTWQLAGGIGDRYGAFSWRLSANHLDPAGPAAGLCHPDPARHHQRRRHGADRRLQ